MNATVIFSDWYVTHTYDYPNLAEALKYAKSNGVSCSIRTPGMTLQVCHFPDGQVIVTRESSFGGAHS
jgi:hypothetical protein